MFMRTGFVVGYGGVWLALLILGLSKLITILTTFSLSAIATNIKMRGGGPYFMISRVLGPDIGGSIGTTLFLAQAVGVAFYVIGFTEALLSTVIPFFDSREFWNMPLNEFVRHYHLSQWIATAIASALFALTFKGADLVIKTQYAVLAILLLSVLSFLIGGFLAFDPSLFAQNQWASFDSDVGFWVAFAIFFPATTGITAGVNMSGDLKEPTRSIPWGTFAAIAFTTVIYVVQMVLLGGGASAQALQDNPFVTLKTMSVLSPLITAGVFAATISSALGSFLGAPRILQAMGKDRLLSVMTFFSKGEGPTNEPRRATALAFLIAVGIIWMGDLNAVAEIISMFFLIAYGTINLSAFVESRSGNPSFRPRFRFFHWGVSLAGAIGCLVAMLKINETYALIALVITVLVFLFLNKQDIRTTFGDAKRGYVFSRTRKNLLLLENMALHPKNWRPKLVAVTQDSSADREMLRAGSWIEGGRGIYSVAEILVTEELELVSRLRQARVREEALRRMLRADKITAFSEVLATKDLNNGLEAFLQSYSLGGLRPNTFLLRLPPSVEGASRDAVFNTIDVASAFDRNIVLCKPSQLSPSKAVRQIDLWWRGERNGSLMALFSYILTLNPAFSGARIRILRIVNSDANAVTAKQQLDDLISHSRLEAASATVIQSPKAPMDIIVKESAGVDIVLLGINAKNGAAAKQSIETLEPILTKLPFTFLVWSNGEATVVV